MLRRRFRSILKIEPWEKTLYIMFVAQLTSAIGFSTIFPFLPLYVQEIGSSRGWSLEFSVGLVFSVQGFTMMVASPIWGALADRYGRKLMVQRATFGGAILILLMGYARSAEDLVLIRAIQGFVTGLVSAANALVASQAPRERTGYAMGVIQVGLWAGVAVGPLIGGAIADAFGYRTAFAVTAVMLASAGVMVWLGVEEAFVPPVKDTTKRRNILIEWRRIFAASGVGMTYVLRFLSNLARMMIFPIAPLFIVTLLPGSDKVNTFTGLVIGVAAAASTTTAIYLGRLGDRIGHRRVLKASALAAALFYLPQSFVTAAWQLLILQGLTGAAAGGIMPTLSALLARYTKPGEEGSVYGLDNSIGAGARALAALTGAMVAHWLGLRSVFAVTALLFFSIVLLAIWRLPETRSSAQRHVKAI